MFTKIIETNNVHTVVGDRIYTTGVTTVKIKLVGLTVFKRVEDYKNNVVDNSKKSTGFQKD